MLGSGGRMKAMMKLLGEFIAWRWAPAVGLLATSMLYVIVVVGLVPSEIGVPVANAKFSQKSLSTSSPTGGNLSGNDTSQASGSSPANETTQASSPGNSPVRSGGSDFGRRGFSPRLDRPDPPSPSPPTVQPPNAVLPAQQGPISGIFSRIQGALRPGSPAALAAAQAAASAAPPAPPQNSEPAVVPGPINPPGMPPPADGTQPGAAPPPPGAAPPPGAPVP